MSDQSAKEYFGREYKVKCKLDTLEKCVGAKPSKFMDKDVLDYKVESIKDSDGKTEIWAQFLVKDDSTCPIPTQDELSWELKDVKDGGCKSYISN